MKYYVIINGVSSETIQGLAIESLPAISKPLQRSRQETIDGRDGDIITKLGYSAYDKTLKIGLWGNYDIDEVIKYFDSEGTITFSNEPDMYYNFNILNRIDFINQLEAFRKATITIHCQPFKYKEEETEELEIITKEVSGTDISVNDSVDGAMDITLKGNTYQKTTSIAQGDEYDSPSPDHPQDINVVSGNNNVVVCGKNLFDKDNANVLNGYISNATQNIVSNANDRVVYIPCKPNTTYTISKMVEATASNNRFVLANTSVEPQISTTVSNITFLPNGTTEKSLSITTNSTANYLVCSIYHTDSSTTFADMLDSIQIEYGETATTYSSYTGATYPINLGSIELCKIGDYKDYFYKQDDKWYLHKEVGKLILNGTEADSDYGTGTTGSFTRFGYIPFINTNLVKIQSDYVSNYFRYLGTIGGDTTEEGISNTQVANLNRLFIFLPTSLVSTISAFKTWLTTHNTIIYYQLATATNTEITDTTLKEQLEAIYNAKSKNGETNINQVNNDMPFILDVSYLSGTNSITIINHGNYYSKPTLTLTGTGNINIYLNDNQIFQVALGTNETIIIDTDKMEAYYESTLKNRQVIGDYNSFKLLSGENTIRISGTFSKLQVDNYSRWI